MKPGENLQRFVRALEKVTNNAPNIKVESPKRMRDKDTGRLREHDVVLTFSLSHHNLVMALECRDRSRKIGAPDVEAFKKKCDRTGVHRAMMVSASGFTSTALKKAEAMDIGCLALEEVDRFDWCLAPGVLHQIRHLVAGPPWHIETAEPFEGDVQLYDSNGVALDAPKLSRLAANALNLRPREIADVQDQQAFTQPVTCSFRNEAANMFHLIDQNGVHVALTLMIMNVTYTMSETLVPFDFRQYIDMAKGRQLYSVALSRMDRGDWKGDVVIHHDGTSLQVNVVPRE